MDTSFTESNALVDFEMKPEYFDTLLNNNVEIQPTKRQKKRSMVGRFSLEESSGDGETKRASAAGPIKDTPRRCKKYTPQRGSRTASVPVAFDSERCRHEIARMLFATGYPLHMVEHKGFMTFFHNLQPKFNMVDFNTAQGDCVATYLSERSTIKNLIARMPGRICLTLDLWNSNNTTGYVFITGQFIDSEWNIHKRLLSVVMELYPESEFAFSHACCTRSPSSVSKMVKKVRDCVKYVKASEALEEYFPDLKQLQVLNTRNLSLDDQTKWNTTYEMLLAASELKEEFSRLDTLYLDYFKIPSGEDWNLIQLELTCASTSEDNIISTITKPMLEGFDKYWKSNCFVLAIAIVMDPRFKMKLVDFSFAKIFGDEAASYINIVDEGIHQLFLDYAAGDVTGYLSNGDGHGLGNTYFDDFIMESASQQSKSELDQYLEESLLPRSHEFEVMRWWKLNEPKYPTLSKMAHDILTLPVSTVDPESVFDTAL
ncbi:zinc finger BED domain-containing protein DAYSLEEPER-like protein [Tanacetum coccineum]